MNPGRITRLACLGLLSALIGCGGAAADSSSLSEAEEFGAYDVYFSGEEVDGNSLEDVEAGSPQKDERGVGWNFYYGTCELPAGEGGCAPPLQIHNYSACRRWAGLLHRKRQLFNLRGAKAAGTGRSLEDPIEIFTGRTTVVLYVEGPDGKVDSRRLAMAAVRQLRNVRHAEPSRLPPPAPGSLWGRLPCQDKPG